MVIMERGKITVETYRTIKLIRDDMVVIMCEGHDVVVKGTSLQVTALSKYEIVIKGTIDGVYYDESNA